MWLIRMQNGAPWGVFWGWWKHSTSVVLVVTWSREFVKLIKFCNLGLYQKEWFVLWIYLNRYIQNIWGFYTCLMTAMKYTAVTKTKWICSAISSKGERKYGPDWSLWNWSPWFLTCTQGSQILRTNLWYAKHES